MDNYIVTTSCKDCVFAISDGENQTGCMANRINQEQISNNTRGFFVLNRYCNLFRPKRWMDEIGENGKEFSKDKLLEVAKKEASPRLTFIINFNYNMNFLSSLLETINSQECRKFVVVVNDKVEYNESVFDLLKNKLSNNVGGFNLVQVVKSSNKFYDNGFKHAKNGWSVFLDKDQKIGKNFAQNLKTRLIDQWKRLVFAQDENGLRKIVQSSVYKMTLNNVKSDGSIDNRPFEEKILDFATSAVDSDCLCKWEEVFDE